MGSRACGITIFKYTLKSKNAELPQKGRSSSSDQKTNLNLLLGVNIQDPNCSKTKVSHTLSSRNLLLTNQVNNSFYRTFFDTNKDDNPVLRFYATEHYFPNVTTLC